MKGCEDFFSWCKSIRVLQCELGVCMLPIHKMHLQSTVWLFRNSRLWINSAKGIFSYPLNNKYTTCDIFLRNKTTNLIPILVGRELKELCENGRNFFVSHNQGEILPTWLQVALLGIHFEMSPKIPQSTSTQVIHTWVFCWRTTFIWLGYRSQFGIKTSDGPSLDHVQRLTEKFYVTLHWLIPCEHRLQNRPG